MVPEPPRSFKSGTSRYPIPYKLPFVPPLASVTKATTPPGQITAARFRARRWGSAPQGTPQSADKTVGPKPHCKSPYTLISDPRNVVRYPSSECRYCGRGAVLYVAQEWKIQVSTESGWIQLFQGRTCLSSPSQSRCTISDQVWWINQ
jgi:hypothetical protein